MPGAGTTRGIMPRIRNRGPVLRIPKGGPVLRIPKGGAALRIPKGAAALRIPKGAAALHGSKGDGMPGSKGGPPALDDIGGRRAHGGEAMPAPRDANGGGAIMRGRIIVVPTAPADEEDDGT